MVSVNNDVTPPIVNIITPINGAVISGSTITVVASASDNVAVDSVQFELDGNNLGPEDSASPYSSTFNTTTFTNGMHTLTATARDPIANQGASAPVLVNINNPLPDSTPPAVNINSPMNGVNVPRNSNLNINATATDNVRVARVDFYSNGSIIGSDTNGPFSYTWRVPGAPNKQYRLQAKATDAAGNSTTSSTITIRSRP